MAAQLDHRRCFPTGPPPGRDAFSGGVTMADLAYALLLIGSFALLVLMLRGLESL